MSVFLPHLYQFPLLLLLLLLRPHPIRCSSEQARCSVVEEQPKGSLVCNLRVQSPPPASSTGLYQLIEQQSSDPAANLFELHRSTGLLVVNQPIDRESIRDCRTNPNRVCQVEVTAMFQSDPKDAAGMRLINVQVLIEDINDNPPEFLTLSSRGVFHSLIREHDRQARILLPRATDPDAGRNGSVTYSFPDGLRYSSPYSKFSLVNGDEGTPELRVVGDIDLEGEERGVRIIELTVHASDEGEPRRLHSNLTVRLAVENTNDFEPQFENGRRLVPLSIPENATVNSVVYRVRATDPDEQEGQLSRLRYSLRSVGDPLQQPFRIDSVSGEIRLASSLDAERQQVFSLEVRAVDGHQPDPRTASMTISVKVEDVNDNAPDIKVSPVPSAPVVSVLENQPPTILALIDITDKDVDERNRRLDCEVSEFNQAQDAFALQPDAASGGHRDNPSRLRYILRNIRPLDRERVSEYSLRLVCHDSAGLSATSNIPIRVQDVNDSPPRFLKSHETMQVSENQPAGTVIGSLLAQDEDEGENALTVYQVSDQCFPYLGIGPRNGSLYTRVSFDRELNSSIACTVTAHDARKPELSAAIGVRIDIKDQNDCSPVFLGTQSGNFTFKVPENSQFGSLIGQLVAKDNDEGVNGRVTFSLAKPNSMFRVLPDGGIKLVARQLDRERSDSHRLFVKAMDHGIPPRWTTAEVLIQVLDENDNSPRFLFPSNRNSTLNVSVHERPGAELAMISADDADFGDNGRLVYSLLGAADTDVIASTTNTVSMPFCDVSLFHLNPSSGLLVLRQSPPIRFADSRVCKLTVRAEDAGPLASARRSSQQSLTVRFTGQQPRRGEGGEGVSDGQPAGDAGRNRGLDGGGSGSGAHDLVVVTVCVGLSFLVLLCVVLLLAYFCYYLQPPGQAAAEDPQDGAARGVGGSRRATGDGLARGRKKRRGWLAKLGLGGVSSNNGGNFDDSTTPTAEHRSDRTMGGRGFISMPVRPPQALLKSAATDESDDEFATAGLQYFANRHSSVKQSGYYQRPRYQQNQMQRRNSEDSDVASAMLPQYAAAAADAFDTDLEIGANSKTSFFRGGLGRLNSMSSEGAKNGSFPESYYKSLRPPSTEPTRRRWPGTQEQQQQTLLLEEMPSAAAIPSQKFQTVRYLVDSSNTSSTGAGSGRTAEGGSRGGFVYGSPYLTSSFV
ncbi:hypothetical protein BOX15_Mlig027051g3 [Macrostomum lignano]|uniref:Cadherin domain-containing protein n=1 Tax=Macrostomum lignano TaxID=282301 RepID=A0A267FRJ3_9PLAT|nr:hypothetical protein BOX15_Mlig027051g3 [Macrostomum lignano]